MGRIKEILPAEIATFTPEEKIKYESDMTTKRDIENQIRYAHDTGIEQGIMPEEKVQRIIALVKQQEDC